MAKPEGFYEFEKVDFEGLWERMRREELANLSAAGKVWKRGDPLDGVDPNLRVFIEKTNNPGITYPVQVKKI